MAARLEGGLAALGRLPALEGAMGRPCSASSAAKGMQSLGHTSQGTSEGHLDFSSPTHLQCE